MTGATTTQPPERAGGPVGTDLYLLAVASRQLAKQAASVLKKDAADLPPAGAQLTAAQAFDALARHPGGEDAMRLQEPAVRLQLIVDLVAQWDATDALDFSRSEEWAAIARLNAVHLAAAGLVRCGWAGSGLAGLLEQMQVDQLRHYNEETWRR